MYDYASDQDAFLTVADAAKELRVSTSSIWRWLNDGSLAGHRLGHRRVLIRRSDLRAVIRRRDGPAVGGLSEEERRRGLKLVEAAWARLRDARTRGVEELPDSVEIIAAMREERQAELDAR